MSEHTPGTMVPGVSIFQDKKVFSAVPDGNNGKIVALFGLCGAEDESESIANVLRFCMAWNEVDELRKDAERYRLLRRGQHFSVIDGIGETLRGECLDSRVDVLLKPSKDAA